MSSAALLKSSVYPDTANELSILRSFLSNYVSGDYRAGHHKYVAQLQEIANRQRDILEINIDDIEAHCGSAFARMVERNCSRYRDLLYKLCDELLPPPSEPLLEQTPFDVWITHRMQIAQRNAQANAENAANPAAAAAAGQNAAAEYLPELLRRYEIQILPSKSSKVSKLREIGATSVGALVSVRGVVTRVTDVQPLIRVSAYICSECGNENFQVESGRVYKPLTECEHPVCKRNEVRGRLERQTRGSKFVRFQSVRLQELHNEVPVGHIPRTLTLRVQGNLTRQCKPGDLITVSGIFLPERFGGFRAMRAGLTADTFIDVTHIVPAKKSYAQVELTPDIEEKIEEAAAERGVYDRLASSIAPEIFGHADIKKALLLLLVAGVTKNLSDGLKIRGDINVLLMGDPGVAKSQLLKHIAHVAPRGVYTTGKGSSGVGLTAAVIRDATSGDLTLEGGSLVLADNGICCIDEFDKMEEGDRTAIHEVMEQQTVSIAKAGITTTLNARTAVLAAANPVQGRWNKRLSPEQNLGLPASLLSRFDLTFIILDTPDTANDLALANHVTQVHINSRHPTAALDFEPFDAAFLRSYIAKARSFTPTVPQALTDFIVGSYVALRKEDQNESTGSSSSTANHRQRFCTARSLLSILRLSQAMARIHFRPEVSREDVEEAMRLMFVSKASQKDDEETGQRRIRDPTSEIFEIIRSYGESHGLREIPIAQLKRAVLAKSYTLEQFEQTINEYVNINILFRTQNIIRFVQHNQYDMEQ